MDVVTGFGAETPVRVFELLEQLKRNSRLNKHQHFCAAERHHRHKNLFGTANILISVLLSSLLLVNIQESLPNSGKWISAVLAMFSAACAGIQTFFNFQKVFEGHRKIANRYLAIQRDVEALQANYADGLIDTQRLSQEMELIRRHYADITNDAEAYPTGDKDLRRALRHEKGNSPPSTVTPVADFDGR